MRRGSVALAGVVCLLVLTARDASPQTPREYQVKAAFLFRFMQFVEWPEAALGDPAFPICIGVLGRDPFGPALEEVTRNEKAQNRPIVVRRSQHAGDLKDCHLVFVSSSEMSRSAQVLAAFGERPVLTVGDAPGFARQGGIINFFLDGSRVRFEINAGEARQAGLRISSQLLGLGKSVESARGGGAD